MLPFDKGCLHLHLPGIYPVNKASTHGIVFIKTFHLQVDGQGAFSHLCHITTEVFKLSSRIGMDLTSILWSKTALMLINRSFSPDLNTKTSLNTQLKDRNIFRGRNFLKVTVFFISHLVHYNIQHHLRTYPFYLIPVKKNKQKYVMKLVTYKK